MTTREIEIKIPLESLGITVDQARARIDALGFTIHRVRVFERNLVFDQAGGVLRESRQLLRLRHAGGVATLTYKGVPDESGKHKSREERETVVANFEEMRVILERLGFRITFIYEKHRTEFSEGRQAGLITLDETPAGDFLELEGEAAWIDETAKRLGAGESHYSTASYGRIYTDWCARNGVSPTHMTYDNPARR